MPEAEMLDCFDGDVTSWRPEPNDPTQWSDLFTGWVTTLDDILEDLSFSVLCVKSDTELLDQGVRDEDIFIHPIADPENSDEDFYDPTYTDKYCALVLLDGDGNYIFPTDPDSLSADWCMMWEADQCPENDCQVVQVNEDGEVVDKCRPLD